MAVQSVGSKIEEILGDEAASLLQYQCKTIPKETLHLPGPDYVERIYSISDRPTRVLTSLQSLLDHGRLGGTGYVSILPVDQGIEHSAGASFAPNPMYFDPENIVKLAIEGGCNAVASTLGVLGSVARKIRAQDSVPAEAEPQRVSLVSERLRSDQVREREAGVRDGRAGAWARRSTSGRKNRSGRSWK